MSRKLSYFGLLFVVAAMLAISLTSVAQASFIYTPGTVTGNADSGIVTGVPCPAAVDLNRESGTPPFTVNGVTFTDLGYHVTSGSGTGWSFSSTGTNFVGWRFDQYGVGLPITGTAIGNVIQGGLYDGVRNFTFNGLTPGWQYNAIFYAFGMRSDAEDVSTAIGRYTNSANGDSFDDDANTSAFYVASNNRMGGHRLVIGYTVPAGGSITFTVTKVSTDVYFMGGFANQFVAVPEPSTLALLATGLIGLLCYAWRKRK